MATVFIQHTLSAGSSLHVYIQRLYPWGRCAISKYKSSTGPVMYQKSYIHSDTRLRTYYIDHRVSLDPTAALEIGNGLREHVQSLVELL